MSRLLDLVNLSAAYGATKVLHGIDLTVSQGTIVSLLGANGAGKTSTLRAICGMLTRQGSINFNDKDISQTRTEKIARLGIGHVPDGRGTFTLLSVEENLKVGAIFRKSNADISADVDRIYGYFPILKKRHRQQAGTLSGGEQQMLAVGRVLMAKPKLLLLDEPSFGLAPQIVAEIFEIFRLLNQREKLSILVVEQNANLALDIADHAYLIETGRIVFSGSSLMVRENEQIQRAYLGG
ncbi:ABC transporter ATP-binding protein [Ottowia thiooxydans]|uniref:Branched-chain amino acid transport system ATP-binding protein n=1 Tax=Ottowia thiooxydans TaxID=219182 RepID=A0ABV2Q4Q2_9BURK